MVWELFREKTKLLLRWLNLKYYALGTNHRCYVCGQSFRRFRPFRKGWKSVSPFLLELQTIGSDVENFACPLCGCHDRERHLLMFFDRLGLWSKIADSNVLHFAPERHLATRIRQHHPATYIKADLTPSSPDVQPVDVTRIPFEDDWFEMIICNHVLEHVPDDAKALAELFRVLKPGGCAVLQTPYSSLLQNSFCDPGIDTDELRNRLYGQEDHVRVYGRDLFTKIEQAGFDLQVKTHADVLADIATSYYGVNPREDLILVAKDAPTNLLQKQYLAEERTPHG